MPHLYLTGYRGCGKTAVAGELAIRLNRPMIDTDDVIEAAAGMSIAEIFAEVGESGFRDRETSALQSVAGNPPSVIALGGGTILREENRRLIASTGVCVWLDADVATVVQRLFADANTPTRRPALSDQSPQQEIETIMAVRRSFYEAASDFRIDTTGKTIGAIALECMSAWKG